MRFGQLFQILASEGLRETEVEHFGTAFGSDDDVGAFEVAMDDAATVRMGQGVGDLNTVAKYRLHGKPARWHEVVQPRAFHVLHHDVGTPIHVADLMNGADVGMVQLRRVLSFPEQSGACGVVRAACDFERDVSL